MNRLPGATKNQLVGPQSRRAATILSERASANDLVQK
jgi:hypothetical protein